ncbi:hypothetical protein JXE69_001280 [Salmonella enterica subsp. houtenae serovar 17:z29:-]|nr:hypothetical protein [Salmonella enterica subsp. houtenae serovar 17:z29:-]
MVEKSQQPDVSVALLARNNGINDNLLFPVSAPYRDFCRAARDSPVIIEDKVVPVVVEHSPALLPAAIPPKPGQVCEVAIGRARLKLSGNLTPAMLATLVRELKKRRR